jgi:excinuclease ABC subunit A
LEILFKGHSIADVLEMTFFEAAALFENFPSLNTKIGAMLEVGLGYLKIGQAANTLSGGEAQRVKLGTELGRKTKGPALYILDEPTTGLHFEDIQKLLHVLQRLVDGGHTVALIEHNPDVIKAADYVIDFGPEGGEEGGYVVATGTPEQVAAVPESHTGRYLSNLIAAGNQ